MKYKIIIAWFATDKNGIQNLFKRKPKRDRKNGIFFNCTKPYDIPWMFETNISNQGWKDKPRKVKIKIVDSK